MKTDGEPTIAIDIHTVCEFSGSSAMVPMLSGIPGTHGGGSAEVRFCHVAPPSVDLANCVA
jgi:hypothetical protein